MSKNELRSLVLDALCIMLVIHHNIVLDEGDLRRAFDATTRMDRIMLSIREEINKRYHDEDRIAGERCEGIDNIPREVDINT